MAAPYIIGLRPQLSYGDKFKMPRKHIESRERENLLSESFEPSEVEEPYEVDRDYNYI